MARASLPRRGALWPVLFATAFVVPAIGAWLFPVPHFNKWLVSGVFSLVLLEIIITRSVISSIGESFRRMTPWAYFATGACILLHAAGQWQGFRLNAWDFGLILEALDNTWRGRLMWTRLCDCNYMSVHQTFLF